MHELLIIQTIQTGLAYILRLWIIFSYQLKLCDDFRVCCRSSRKSELSIRKTCGTKCAARFKNSLTAQIPKVQSSQRLSVTTSERVKPIIPGKSMGGIERPILVKKVSNKIRLESHTSEEKTGGKRQRGSTQKVIKSEQLWTLRPHGLSQGTNQAPSTGL